MNIIMMITIALNNDSNTTATATATATTTTTTNNDNDDDNKGEARGGEAGWHGHQVLPAHAHDHPERVGAEGSTFM